MWWLTDGRVSEMAKKRQQRDRSATPPKSAAGGSLTAEELGFERVDPMNWHKEIGGRRMNFRRLRRVPELLPVEGLQREVFRVNDRDLAAASQLVVVPETGGEVIGAFVVNEQPMNDDDLAADMEELVGFVIGWGGYHHGRPLLVSDMLGVRVDLRRTGLGAELKALQAAVALESGFAEMTWTFDPLRAPNARLNFEKLGATANRYEEDRYGPDYAASLYGGIPTDRLHVIWSLESSRVRERLLGLANPTTLADIAGLTHYDPGSDVNRALIYFPADIDRLIMLDPNAAWRWRLTLRETMPKAFAQGFAITGFVVDVDEEQGYVAYVIER
jgi:chorismate synthase